MCCKHVQNWNKSIDMFLIYILKEFWDSCLRGGRSTPLPPIPYPVKQRVFYDVALEPNQTTLNTEKHKDQKRKSSKDSKAATIHKLTVQSSNNENCPKIKK